MAEPNVHELVSLLEALTDKECAGFTPDAQGVAKLKKMVRRSDELTTVAFTVLLDRLQAKHAQARLLALRVSEELFKRSSKFRSSMALHFAKFLSYTIGHLEDWPLPPPAHTAATLREQALDLIDEWSLHYGDIYPQLRMGYRYLKDALKLEFPHIRSRQAERERQEREQRERRQAHLRQRYAAVVQGMQEQMPRVASSLAELEQLLEAASSASQQQEQQQEVQETKEVDADAQAEQQQGAAAAAAGSAPATAEEEEEWEDVAAAKAPAPAPHHQGLSAYDADVLCSANAAAGAAAAGGAAVKLAPQLADTLREAAQLAERSCLPLVQDWLKLLMAIDLSHEPQQNSEKQRCLRQSVDLKARMQAALLAAQALLGPEDDAGAEDAGPADGATGGGGGGAGADVAAGAALQEAVQLLADLPAAGTGLGTAGLSMRRSSSSSSLRVSAAVARWLSDSSTAASAAAGAAATPAGRSPAARGTQRAASRLSAASGSSRRSGRPARPAKDPYAKIQDPTAPARGKFVVHFNTCTGELLPTPAPAAAPGTTPVAGPDAAAKKASAEPAAAGQGSHAAASQARQSVTRSGSNGSRSSGLPEHVRASLLAQAPVLPPSAEMDWWSVPTAGSLMVNQRGLEISNHWGPVDDTAERPAHLMQQLLGYSSSYYRPTPAPHAAAAAASGSKDAAPAGSVVERAGSTSAPGGKAAGEASEQPAAAIAVGPKTSFAQRKLAMQQRLEQQRLQQEAHKTELQQQLEQRREETAAAAAAAAAKAAAGTTAAGKVASPAGAQPGAAPAAKEAAAAAAAVQDTEAVAAALASTMAVSKKRQREADKLHNLTVMAEGGDEAAARRLQEMVEAEAKAAEKAGKAARKQAKQPPSKADKLRKKLLS